MNPARDVHSMVDHLFRHHAATILSTLSRRFGLENLDLAEEVVQEAMLQALRLWPFQGVPENPRAWLTQVAQNKALDLIRRRSVFRRKHRELGEVRVSEADLAQFGPEEDEQLAMIFACNHPVLSPEARIALTLKAACGFSLSEIARAFLCQESTIAQRIVRAKRMIREHGVALVLPTADQLSGRLDSVLQVIYLLFNEGYSAHRGDALIRHELCNEAIWLADGLANRPETSCSKTHALLALLKLQSSRLPARIDNLGEIVLLPDQDRSRWNVGLIHQGLRHLELASEGDELTVYHLQAGIAAVHAIAVDDASTNWARLLELYDVLREIAPSPIVSLNRAVALARVEGPGAGLAALDETGQTSALDDYFLWHATRADFLQKLGRIAEAHDAYRSALESTCTEPERRFLHRKFAECHED